MLINFINRFNKLSPDVLTGWFINGFDLPYIVKRLRRLKLNDFIQKLSPFYKTKMIDELSTHLVYSIVEDFDKNPLSKDEVFSKIYGIEIVDLLKVYRKLTYDNKPDNYRLNTVAKHLKIGEKIKVKDEGSGLIALKVIIFFNIVFVFVFVFSVLLFTQFLFLVFWTFPLTIVLAFIVFLVFFLVVFFFLIVFSFPVF